MLRRYEITNEEATKLLNLIPSLSTIIKIEDTQKYIDWVDFYGFEHSAIIDKIELLRDAGIEPPSVMNMINAYNTIDYKPKPHIINISNDTIELNKVTKITVVGSFLDYIKGIEVVGIDDEKGIVENIDYNFGQLSFDLTVTTSQIYTITFESIQHTTQKSIIGIDATIIIPNVDVLAPALWVKSITSNNSSSVSEGSFSGDDSSGNGWNDHAYFGPLSSNAKLDFEFTIDRLQGASTAYCYIRFNTTNNPTTSGQPKVYIHSGNTIAMTDVGGNQTSTSVVVGDKIKIKFTTISMIILKNGVEIMSHTGTYNLTNIYMTLTAYRVLRLIDIKATIH